MPHYPQWIHLQCTLGVYTVTQSQRSLSSWCKSRVCSEPVTSPLLSSLSPLSAWSLSTYWERYCSCIPLLLCLLCVMLLHMDFWGTEKVYEHFLKTDRKTKGGSGLVEGEGDNETYLSFLYPHALLILQSM